MRAGRFARSLAVASGVAAIAGVWVLSTPGTVGAAPSSFACTGSMQQYTVPAGMTTISVDVLGAQGGNWLVNPSSGATLHGGLGGETTATVPVQPGEVLDVQVGCAAENMTEGDGATGVGGFGGGGDGGGASAPGGGGASLIADHTTHQILVEAGGGGGAGVNFCNSLSANGGAGGGLTGSAGGAQTTPCTPDGLAGGGAGGTQSTGGAGGTAGSGTDSAGGAGASQLGGSGGTGVVEGLGGGGGGGGFFGGGGGGGGDLQSEAEAGGGGGGSGYAGPSATGAVLQAGVRAGDGAITITPSAATTPVTPSPAPVVAQPSLTG